MKIHPQDLTLLQGLYSIQITENLYEGTEKYSLKYWKSFLKSFSKIFER